MASGNNHAEYMQLVEKIKSKVPKDEWREVMSQEYCEYELGKNDAFLGFLHIYEDAKKYIPKSMTVVDMGCYLAAQAYLYEDYSYIGVDADAHIELKRFSPANSVHLRMTIQEYVKKYDAKSDSFAIVSYVHDQEAMQIVEDNFENCYIYYPQDRKIIKVNGKYIVREQIDILTGGKHED